jgi:uncharacterized protein YuzE
MKTIYDDKNDTLFIRFAQEQIVESEEIAPGVIFDYDEDGKMVGFELLNASKSLSKSSDLIKESTAA